MTRTLLLLRHGKASQDEVVDDHDRPLAKRGRHDAHAMGVELRARNLVPEVIVTSSAKRARSTACRVAKSSGYGRDLVVDRGLYDSSITAYWEAITAVPDAAQTALFVGHNPLLEQVAQLLTGREVTLATASLVCIDLPIATWHDLKQDTRGTVRFVLLASQLSMAPGTAGERPQ
jgi:phosphohistidine phosphatase